jgi:enoyl-CoA hydratase/carnithine racemase
MSAARTSWAGQCLTYQVEGGVLEVALHRDPANEIGLDMLRELERLAALITDGAGGAHAMLIHSEVARGFSAGADLRELHAGLQSVGNGANGTNGAGSNGAGSKGASGAWIGHAQRLFDRPSTALRAGASTLRSAFSTASLSRARSNGWLAEPARTAKVWGVRSFLDRIHRVFDTLDMAPIPTIAAVHGVCFGGGLELALTCDVIVADKTARFAFPELRLGLIPGFGGIPRLERDLGNAVVRDLLLSGRSLGAQRAHEVGLAAQLVAEGHATRSARRLAAQMGRFDPVTAAAAKRFIKPFPRERLEAEKDLFCQLLTSQVVEQALDKFISSTSAMPYLP